MLIPIPINPLVYPVFKALFGTEANKDILMSFLNAVLEFIDAPKAFTLPFSGVLSGLISSRTSTIAKNSTSSPNTATGTLTAIRSAATRPSLS